MPLSYGSPTVATGPLSGGPYSGPVSFAHDNDGAGLLLVTVATVRPTGTTVTANATYDGVATVEVDSVHRSGGTGWPGATALLLEDPAAGSNTLSVSFSSEVTSYVITVTPITSYKAGDLTGSDTASAIGDASGASLNVTTDEDGSDLVMLYVARDPDNHAPLAPGVGITELDENVSDSPASNNDLVTGLYKKTVPTAGADTIDNTASATDRRVAVAFELKAATDAAQEAALSLATSAGITTDAEAVTGVALSLAASIGVAVTGNATAEALASFETVAAMVLAGDATVEASLTLGAGFGYVTGGGQVLESTMSLGAGAGVAVTGDVSIEASLALAMAAGVADDATVTAVASMSLGAGAGYTATGAGVAEALVSLGTIHALQIVAAAVIEAGLSLDAIGGITTVGADILVSINVSPGRTIIVKIESREVSANPFNDEDE